MRISLIALVIMVFGFSAKCQTEKLLSPQQMQQDLKILHSAWTSLHPGIYRYNSPRQLQGYFDTLFQLCSLPADEKVFYVRLAQLAEKIKCGHTYLNPLNLSDAAANRILPARVIPLFFVVSPGNKIIITHNLS